MKTALLGSAALLAVSASLAAADGHLMVAPGEGGFNWDSYNAFADANDFSGEQLTIFGPWLGPDAEALEKVLAYFNEATGADVRYTGSDSFETQIVSTPRRAPLPTLPSSRSRGLPPTWPSGAFSRRWARTPPPG